MHPASIFIRVWGIVYLLQGFAEPLPDKRKMLHTFFLFTPSEELDGEPGRMKTQNTFNAVVKVIREERRKQRLSFLIGNGINLQFGTNGSTWDGILGKISKKYQINNIDSLPPTEQYSALVLSQSEKTIRGEVLKEISMMKMDEEKLDTFNKILKGFNCPVLTTNFDSNLDGTDNEPQTLNRKGVCSGKEGTHKSMETLSIYWGGNVLQKASDGYGVWHINGHHNYKDTIRLGLIDYGKQCSRVFNLTKVWKLDKETHTWLDPFLKKPLCIVGLRLDEAEVFLRWLLLRKAHIYKRRKCLSPGYLGWYCYVPEEKGNKDYEKQQNTLQFLKAARIIPVPFDDYNSIYLSIFDLDTRKTNVSK